MEQDSDIGNIPFFPISIGENRYNINRSCDDDNSILLSDFSDASPLFDMETGPHLAVKIKDGKTIKKVPIPLPKMLIPNAKTLNLEDYYRAVIKAKREFVDKTLIKQTFALGYEHPSTIQSLGLIELILGRDALIQSKSGTGKTHLFLFGCLWHFDPADSALQHVVITSSHEVAVQIYDKACKLLRPPVSKEMANSICQKLEVLISKKIPSEICTQVYNCVHTLLENIYSSNEEIGKIYKQIYSLLFNNFSSNDQKAADFADEVCSTIQSLMPRTAKIALCIGQKKESSASSTGSFKTPIGTSTLNIKHKTLKEEKEEAQHAQVIICTMGKFYDILCNKKWISLDYLKSICVDEFDNIVSTRSRAKSSTIMNTEEQMASVMKTICDISKRRKTVDQVQRIFCSATVTEQSLNIAYNYFRSYHPDIGEPFIVLLDLEDYTLEGIRQYYVVVEKYDQKFEVLLDLIKQCRITQAIIYANRIETAMEIKRFLDEQEVRTPSAVFHGKLSSNERSNIHNDMMKQRIRILISTDVTSRGLDIHSINLVINFDMPDTLESYIHRIGRSGRFGRKGIAISLILVNRSINEMRKLETINECSKNSKVMELQENLETLL